jgi:uncharacterized protein (TIGR00255 family)
MIKSMTGFGKKERQFDGGVISTQIRAVNSRYLDISVRLPEVLNDHEEDLKRLIGEQLNRGRITGAVSIVINDNNGIPRLKINKDVLKQYYASLKDAVDSLGLKDKITLQHLLNFPDLLDVNNPSFEVDTLIAIVKQCVSDAVKELDQMRIREGQFLADKIKQNLDEVERIIKEIERLSTGMQGLVFQKYSEQLQALCKDLELNQDRILQEAAMLTKKLDITEECHRIDSHLSQFRLYLTGNEPAGKKMTFLLQEMNREITTIGSKVEIAEISHLVVNLKSELEKIREQAQNIL